MINVILFLGIGFIFFFIAQMVMARITINTGKVMYPMMISYLMFIGALMWLGGYLLW